MSWKHWTAIIAVILVGIVLQIPGHEDEATTDQAHQQAPAASSSAGAPDDPAGPYRMVALDVTGMT